MRAIVVNKPGGPEALTVVDRPTPVPGPGEVRISAAAAGVNRADVMQRQGFYDPPPGATDILGLECSGVIDAVGDEVTGWTVGDQVCALLSGGGYAEQVVAPVGQVAPVPSTVRLRDAAGLVEVAATVWSNVFLTARLTDGETLLVHGGSSGIGTMAIQIAKARGARVVVTAGSDAKLDACRELGADVTINYRTTDFADALAAEEIRPDVILDNMGAKYLARNVDALAPNGRLVVIGLQGGVKAEINLNTLLRKRASVTATSLRARPPHEKAEIVASMVDHVWPLLESGAVRPIIDRSFALEDAAAAHRLMEASTHIGKVLLEVTG